jgi:hypothetical protein
MKTIKKSMNGEDFKNLCKNNGSKIREGAVLVMDNLKAHK